MPKALQIKIGRSPGCLFDVTETALAAAALTSQCHLTMENTQEVCLDPVIWMDLLPLALDLNLSSKEYFVEMMEEREDEGGRRTL